MKNESNKDIKLYTCKNDLAFKEVFMKEENKDLLIVLLESCLEIKIKDLEYLNLEKNVDNIHVRRKHFDLHVKTEKENIHIEVNSQMKDYVRPRNASFIFDTYSHEIRKSDDYSEETLFIQINFTYGLSEASKYNIGTDKTFHIYKLSDEDNNSYINNLLIYEFNMDYISKMWYNNFSKKEKKRYIYLFMMNLQLDELKVVSSKDRMVEKYMSELKRVNEDPEFREYISAEDDNRKIENSLKKQYMREAREEGLKKGREEGLKKGQEEGLKKGQEEGLKEGLKEGKKIIKLK